MGVKLILNNSILLTKYNKEYLILRLFNFYLNMKIFSTVMFECVINFITQNISNLI